MLGKTQVAKNRKSHRDERVIQLPQGRLQEPCEVRRDRHPRATSRPRATSPSAASTDGRYQFQYWAVSLVEANPAQNKKKGADGGVDGIKFFRDLDKKDAHKIVVSVKSGNVGLLAVRELIATRLSQNAEIALLITLPEPTKPMLTEAISAGFYKSVAGQNFPRIQILTIAGLLNKTQRAEHPDYEPDLNFKKAKSEASGEQAELL